jgi:hypothetical protein
LAAAIAKRSVDLRGYASEGNGRTGLAALTACLTAVFEKNRFRDRILGCWVGAPLTGQGTSLQKDHSSDARAVVNAEFLDIENNVFSQDVLLGPIPDDS